MAHQFVTHEGVVSQTESTDNLPLEISVAPVKICSLGEEFISPLTCLSIFSSPTPPYGHVDFTHGQHQFFYGSALVQLPSICEW
ncbi:predicted protein [Botrytis cinerea T4]|uniref:Uncharacterized protein n=1 Tax=Botryotinia fuckeliana (strain T4) TaxID=999810 RepID=G2YRH8_BOTF4|nr:predicted protein [Botrytis cinerea T4]